MSRYTDYYDRVTAGDAELHWQLELVASTGEVIASNEPDTSGDVIEWGAEIDPLEFGPNQLSQRTASLTVQASDRKLSPAVGGSLHPESMNRVVISAGLRLSDGTIRYWPQGSMLIEEVEETTERGLTIYNVSLTDPLTPVRSELGDSFSLAAGEKVSSVVSRLLAQVLPEGSFVVADTEDCKVPAGVLTAGTSRSSTVAELLEGCGHELVAGPTGLIYTRAVPPSSDDPSAERWRYGMNGIPITSATRIWRARVPMAWKIEGGSFVGASMAPTVVVYDTDPSSEGFFRPDSPHQEIRSSRLPFVESIPQAVMAGYANLRRSGTGPMIITFQTVPNPALLEGDLIDLDIPNLNAGGAFRVMGYTLPIHVDGPMTVIARAVWDPALNYELPFDRSEGCVLSITDTFNRANSNLENLAGSPGSDNWTEHRWSWGVVDQRAVQRYPNGWSMAVHAAPLCHLDQEASIKVHEIPSGRSLGPMIRSSGEFDGYAALSDSNGRITLEMWLAGQRVATLASHQADGSVDGKTLKVKAVGSTITVELNSDVVITATDDRRQGTFAGMLGYGGTEQTGPKADEFTAGTAS